jgi:hypothetical protein
MKKTAVPAAMAAVSAATLLFTATGCSTQAKPLTKTEKEMFTAPLGQPMPPEAKAAIARMQQDAAKRPSQAQPPPPGPKTQ